MVASLRANKAFDSPGTWLRALDSFWRVLGVAVAYTMANVLGGLFVRSLGLSLPAIAERTDPFQSLLSSFLTGVLLGVALFAAARRLTVPVVERVVVLFLVVYVLNSLVNLIEARYFTTYFSQGFTSTLVVTGITALGSAVSLAALFPPSTVDGRLGSAVKSMFAARAPLSWVWRVVLAAVLYVPTYFVFGSLAYPFVRRFYEDPSLGLGLQVPGPEVILPLEIGRGLLYVLALLPFVALWKGRRWTLALALGLIIAALNGWIPLALNGSWPIALRLTHGLEITGDALVQGATVAALIAVPRRIAQLTSTIQTRAAR